MAQYEIPGRRSTLTPEGRVIHQIPVSTDADVNANAPATPPGTQLVSAEYTQRPDGGRDYLFTYESASASSNDKAAEIAGQAAQEPIETHPKFNGGGVPAGQVTQADLAEIRRALSEGTPPVFTGTGTNLERAQALYQLRLKGVENYFTPSGVTYSETVDEQSKPNLSELCRIDQPPADAPTLPSSANWLQIGLRAQKLYNPESRTTFWRVTREWLASGPRGWNADFEIYG